MSKDTEKRKTGRPAGKIQDAEIRVVMPSAMLAEVEAIAEAYRMSKSAVMRAAFEATRAKWLTEADRERIAGWDQP